MKYVVLVWHDFGGEMRPANGVAAVVGPFDDEQAAEAYRKGSKATTDVRELMQTTPAVAMTKE